MKWILADYRGERRNIIAREKAPKTVSRDTARSWTGVIPRKTLKISASAMSSVPAKRPIARTLSPVLVGITCEN